MIPQIICDEVVKVVLFLAIAGGPSKSKVFMGAFNAYDSLSMIMSPLV